MMKGQILEELCDRVKRKCGITWNDEDTEQKIRDIVENAAVSLKNKLGIRDQEEIFLYPGMTRTLFENYCMYDWNNMLEDFSNNYRDEIIGERHRYEVENAKKASEELQ